MSSGASSGDLSDLAIERALLARYQARRAEWQQSTHVNEASGKGKAAQSQISRLTGLILRCEERIRELEGAAPLSADERRQVNLGLELGEGSSAMHDDTAALLAELEELAALSLEREVVRLHQALEGDPEAPGAQSALAGARLSAIDALELWTKARGAVDLALTEEG